MRGGRPVLARTAAAQEFAEPFAARFARRCR
jgi:hypothetical protein